MAYKDKKKKAEYNKKWYEANRERLKDVRKKWYEANKEKADAYRRKWVRENKEHVKQKRREHEKENREKINKQSNEWRKNNMDKIRLIEEKYYKSHPWARVLKHIKTRCNNSKSSHYHRYGGRGIKCLITRGELKTLWFRDSAFNLNQASIDRIDNDGHYELSNCRFIELSENSRRRKKLCKLYG